MAGCRLIVAALTVMSIARSLARSTPIICRGWPISVRSCSPPMARLFATAEHSSADTDAVTDTVPNTVNHSNNQAEQTNYYTEFLDNRPWERAEQFWREMVPITDVHALPAFVRGTTFMRNDIDFTTGSRYGNSDDEYGVTDLRPLYAAGEKGEFFSADYRYCKRHTYAMRIGYVGTEFYGYQMQNGSNVTTVEGDIRDVIGKSGYAAGRTDRGVSALSQIVGFVTDKVDFDIDAFISKVRNSEPCQSGRLAIYECVRVPKKFNARSEATWRRYLYLIPLNSLAEVTDTAIPSDEPVVDVKLMNSILQR